MDVWLFIQRRLIVKEKGLKCRLCNRRARIRDVCVDCFRVISKTTEAGVLRVFDKGLIEK